VNKLIAEVLEIKSLDRLNLIKFGFNSQVINVLILEMNLDLKIGKNAELMIKPTAISILKQSSEFENVLKGKVKKIINGEILSRVIVDVEGFEIESIMLKEKVNFENDVFVVFKSNDVAISKALND
jgi:molybdopterin-binding protein